LVDTGPERRADGCVGRVAKAEATVERLVPRNVAEGGQRDVRVSVRVGPLLYRCDQGGADAAAAVLRVDVDFLQVDGPVEDLEVREADRPIGGV
jgi:hypothetical protein